MFLIKSLLGVIYPNKCMLCRSMLTEFDDLYVCRLCHEKIHGELQILRKYKNNTISGLKKSIEMPEDVPKQIIYLFPYESEYRRTILRWKYKGFRKYARGFAKIMVDEGLFSELDELDEAVLVPIPLAPSRMRKRGFNQALDLAREIEKRIGIPVVDCLKRIQDTKPQAGCSREERFSNVKDSMQIRNENYEQYEDIKSIILVDDIYTTGSTIKEAIRVLRRKFVFKKADIYVVVVGKGNF